MIWVNGNYLSTEYTAFDLGCIYQKSSKANYWRQCFVNLDDYIGDTVIIAFDYVVAHNYNNYDWWVDDVRVEVFDNVFGGGSEVTEGSWDDPNMWGGGGNRSGGLPTADDNVLINAKVTIPEGFIAEANRIVLNLDTIADVKYGNVFIADEGQSVVFTTTEPGRSQGMSFSLSKIEQERGGASVVADRARIRFGEGDNLGKLALMADANRLYIPQNGTDYAVVFSQPVGELPLNFEAAENGTYTLSFENATEGLMYCHLIDNLTGADIDLLTPAGFPLYKGGQGDSNAPRQAEYTFTAKTTDYASRFKVVFASVCGDANDDSEPFAFNHNGQWIILNEGRATLQVVDLMGRILSSEQIEGSASKAIHAAPGVYIIRLVNGEIVKVQKIVLR